MPEKANPETVVVFLVFSLFVQACNIRQFYYKSLPVTNYSLPLAKSGLQPASRAGIFVSPNHTKQMKTPTDKPAK